ncbi:MAG: sigma-70 family RNA polymerase sigma factor [Acidobacteriaceae bacterium]
MKDYRVTVKVRNNRILQAIKAVGGAPGMKWCKENKLSYPAVNNLINMTVSPLREDGNLSDPAQALCDVVMKLPEELWSNEQLYPLEKNFSEMEMDFSQIVSLLPQEKQSYLPDFSEIEQKQTRKLLDKALSTLSPREAMVLRMRTEEDLTLDECAIRLNVCRERIHQIEAKALIKLRHPARVGIISDALDLSEENRKKFKLAEKEFFKSECTK